MPPRALALIALCLMAPTVLAETVKSEIEGDSSAERCVTGGEPLDEQTYVPINGIDHWVTLRGDRCDNPVILFLHGGPANPISPYADAIYGDWSQDFTLVQWDQRGSGKTFIRNPPDEDSVLTIEQMADDGIALTQYLRKRLRQDKLILMGSSWGSALGVQIVKTRPELFHAYIGTAQIVSQSANQTASYEATLALARAAQDAPTIEALEGIGSPPWTNPRNFGVLRRASRAYEARTSTATPAEWWVPAASYEMEASATQYEAAEEYSFLQFVGFNNDGMYSKIDFPSMGIDFDVPVFLIQGEQDLVTLPTVSKDYFDRIRAPSKGYFTVPQAGHSPNLASVAMERKVLMEHVLPLIAK